MAEPSKTQLEENPLSPPMDGGAPLPPVVEPVEQQVTPPAAEPEVKEEPIPDFSEFLPPELSDAVKSAEPVKPTEAEPVVQQTPAAASKVTPRDYSDLPADVQPLFKNMSNEAFNALKPIYLKHKQQEAALAERDKRINELSANRLPDNYYENERAFMLTPEFVEAATGVQRAQTVQQHWQEQLVRIREGADIQNLSVNEKGEFQLSGPLKVTPQIEAQVMSLLNQAQNEVSRHNVALQSLAGQHKMKHSEAKNWLGNFDKQSFAVFEKPENEHLRKIADDTVASFHPSYKHNPLAPVLAKAMVTIMGLGNMLKQQQATAPAAGQQARPANGKIVDPKDVRAAGPTATGMASGGKPSGPDVTFEDFERVIQGLPA